MNVFFEHIEERYGIAVAKILKYHDIDRYKILSQVDEHQLINFFEKPNDEHSISELANLKNEICNISQESITLKVETKAKLVSLLKSAQFIVKKKKFQVLSQARSNRLDNHRSSLSSTDNNGTDSEKHFSLFNTITSYQLKQINSVESGFFSVHQFIKIIVRDNDEMWQ
ncbi:unnamed protein product [Rotaria sp. Silwood2]|nr:unnamed protein product [Rotaria sp. Silwood2]